VDPELAQILPAAPLVQQLGSGFTWSEGPVWVADEQMLLFSDVPRNTIFKWTEADGIGIYLQPSGYSGLGEYSREPGSNGLTIDADGQLLLCQHGNRQIARMDAPLTAPEPDFITLTDNYDGQRFNSPNDLCLSRSSGYLYFTDPPYGLPQQMDSETKELPFQGVFRWREDVGTELIYDGLSRPNGIALSPDERRLYVANSDGERAVWMVFDIDAQQNVGNGRVFYDATADFADNPGLPDGLKVDSQGYIYATGPGGVWFFNPELEPLGVLKVGQLIANCALDEENGWLYLTADDYLLRARLVR
jgi:gluconolactonase